MVDTPNGETIKPEALENNVNPPATPAVNAVDQAEVERLKKEAEQARMRANQVQNELDKIKADAEAAKQAQLEKNQQFEDLYKQEKAKNEAAEADQLAREKAAATKAAADSVLADYSDDVRALAKDLGVSLSDDSDDAIAAFKAKLDSAASKVGTPKVTPNNGQIQKQNTTLDGEDLRKTLTEPTARDEFLKQNFPGIAQML